MATFLHSSMYLTNICLIGMGLGNVQLLEAWSWPRVAHSLGKKRMQMIGQQVAMWQVP